MVRVRSAHVGGDGEIYAYVQCDGHVRRVGKEAFVPLKTGGYRLDCGDGCNVNASIRTISGLKGFLQCADNTSK